MTRYIHRGKLHSFVDDIHITIELTLILAIIRGFLSEIVLFIIHIGHVPILEGEVLVHILVCCQFFDPGNDFLWHEEFMKLFLVDEFAGV